MRGPPYPSKRPPKSKVYYVSSFIPVPSLLTCDATIDRMMSKWSTFCNSTNRLEEECRINVFRKNDIYLTPQVINNMIQCGEEMVDQLGT